MRNDAIKLEEERLDQFEDLSQYDQVHERHRIFPSVFGSKDHKRVIDLSAGMGVVATNIRSNYNCELICNDISPKCIRTLKAMGFDTVSFDLDNPEKPFPFPDGHFDAVITLATIEHMINVDHFISEIYRILSDDGYLYISAPNYSGLNYLIQLLLTGKTFHNPLDEKQSYEFHAHVRYFTYRTLLEYVSQFNFHPEVVYLPRPQGSSRYVQLKKNNPALAFTFKAMMTSMYKLFSPRWAAEPVLCFQKSYNTNSTKTKKLIV